MLDSIVQSLIKAVLCMAARAREEWGTRKRDGGSLGGGGGQGTLPPYTRIVQAEVVQALRCVGAKMRP